MTLRTALWVAFVSGNTLDEAHENIGHLTPAQSARVDRWWRHWMDTQGRLYGMRELASRRHGEIGKAQRRRRMGGGSRSSLATRWR